MARKTLKLTSPLMSGSDVTDFQKLVTSKGFSCGAIDGKYGKNSVSACKKFQASVGLSVDGICGPKTWGKLEAKTRRTLKLTSPMMKGEDVKEFQTKVTKHGFSCGTIDSIYGQKAKAACIAFTKSYVGYVHAIAHALGGMYHIPHGEACAIALPGTGTG